MPLRQFRSPLPILTLIALLLFPGQLPAQDHVVSPADLHQELQAAAQARQANRARLEKFFSSESVRKALRSARIDCAQVEKAVPLLTDDEAARLGSLADKLQNDLAAGALNNQQITYIIIALATAVIILVIVAAR